MVVGELVEYLKEHLALGYDLHELKLQLVRYGHSPKNVEEALEILKKEALSSLPQPPLPSHVPPAAQSWLLTPALLFILLLSIGVIVYFLRNPAL
ncbi:MAG: hypothetical protein QXM31_02745 [Candidatus Woesearchaeota archaeon]